MCRPQARGLLRGRAPPTAGARRTRASAQTAPLTPLHASSLLATWAQAKTEGEAEGQAEPRLRIAGRTLEGSDGSVALRAAAASSASCSTCSGVSDSVRTCVRRVCIHREHEQRTGSWRLIHAGQREGCKCACICTAWKVCWRERGPKSCLLAMSSYRHGAGVLDTPRAARPMARQPRTSSSGAIPAAGRRRRRATTC